MPLLITTGEEYPPSQSEKSTLSQLEKSTPTTTKDEESANDNQKGSDPPQIKFVPSLQYEWTLMMQLESSHPHIETRQGTACTLLLERISPTASREESPLQL